MGTRMLQRRGTSAEWASANPVLGDGEVGLDKTTGVFKIGDGTTAWASLTNVYRRFVDAVAKAGDTMTGQLNLPSALLGSDTRIGQEGTGGLRVTNAANNAWANIHGNEIRGQSVFDGGNRVYSASNPQSIPNAFDVINAVGDILVGSGDNAVTRLAKGANNTVLTVNGSGTVTWATPAASNPFTAIDAAGDLIVGTGNDAATRLAKGANGTVLGIDGSGNVAWVQPSEGIVSTQTSTYSVGTGVGVVLADGTFTVTLPAAASNGNRIINVKNTGTGVITIATSGGTIDGETTISIEDQYYSVTVVSDGTNWFII